MARGMNSHLLAGREFLQGAIDGGLVIQNFVDQLGYDPGLRAVETGWLQLLNSIESLFKMDRCKCSEAALTSHLGSVAGGKAVPFFSLLTIKDDFPAYKKSFEEVLALKGVPWSIGYDTGAFLERKGPQLMEQGRAIGSPLSSYGAALTARGSSLSATGSWLSAGAKGIAHWAGRISTYMGR
jgi:hypothetical protein